MAASAITLSLTACSGKPGKPEPKTDTDSLAVAMGIMYGNQMNQSFAMSRQQGQPIDSMEFLRGFKESLNDSTKFSYFAGGITAGNIGAQLRADSIDAKMFYKAFYAATINDSTQLSMTVEKAQEYLEKANAAKREKEMKAQFGKNITAGKAYMEKFLKEEGVQKTKSGLAYKVLRPGTGATPTAEDTVKVKYVGNLVDGSEFDKNEEGIEFGVNGVIAGWTEMLQLMKEGEKVKVVIPHELAYGDRGQGMEPYSTLIFEIELLKVIKATK